MAATWPGEGELSDLPPEALAYLARSNLSTDWGEAGGRRTWIVVSENRSLHRDMMTNSRMDSVAVFGSILAIWSLLLNAALIWIIVRRLQTSWTVRYDWLHNRTYSTPTGRSPLHWLIVNFAGGQILMAVFIIPVNVVTEIRGRWELDGLTCKVWLLVQMALVSLTMWTVFAVVLERFVLLVRPAAYSGRRARVAATVTVLASWVASLSSVVPVAVMMKNNEDFLLEDEGVCAIGMTMVSSFIISFVLYFTPAILTLAAILALVITLVVLRGRSRRHQRLLQASQDNSPEATPALSQIANRNVGGTASSENLGVCDATLEPGVTCFGCTHVTVIAVFLLCAVCWGPFYVTNLLLPFCDGMCVDPSLWTFFIWLGYSTSGVTPVAWLLEPQVRKALRKSVKRDKKQQSYR